MSRIVFALRCDIRMCPLRFRLDVITGNNIFRQWNKRLNLCRFKRGEIFTPADFCQPRFSSSMPIEVSFRRVAPRQALIPTCQPVFFRHQLPDARYPLYRGGTQDQIMRADLLIGQCCRRAVKIICGVVDHQHFNARIRRLRLASVSS